MNTSNINYCWGSLIVQELVRCGVDYFYIASGSRSSPLTVSAGQNKRVKTLVHFDERALAFHALGYASVSKKPVVLICTSATAAANFFPAIIEASKKKLPLIVLTADRPPELRQTGAVQTIDQAGLFGKYAKHFVDLPCPDLNIKPEFVLTTIDQAWYQAVRHPGGVVHINCMFREPLAPIKTKDDLASYTKSLSRWLKSNKPYTQYMNSEVSGLKDTRDIIRRINGAKSGVMVVGKMAQGDQKEVLLLAEKLGWPIFADLTSGLRLGCQHPLVIHYFDQILLSQQPTFDGVLHLGGRITSKRYYEFIEKIKPSEYITVLNHPLRNDPTHQVSLRVESSVGNFCKIMRPLLKKRTPTTVLKKLFKFNGQMDKAIEDFLKEDAPINEITAARLVSQLIPRGSGLFVANSMPIRDMDFYADFKGSSVIVAGNRGASGIDGTIASAAGFARSLGQPVTLMIGDLAALHDVNSLAMLRDLLVPLVIVVLNNGGGGIFSFLPMAEHKDVFEKYFGTPHSYTFANAAAMFELNYVQPMDTKYFTKVYTQALKSPTSTVIEVVTSRQENVKIHKLLQQKLSSH
ncbi:MAG: 2-succinyl-5-enolpyruvyl-6-hydroxy-3-cyclohexene-1-carboxylic-acid synthase [Candidatus Omnitrophica bacterium]|nr:2-succinyl-5-enolpyruvyl-6-hydroxy-3-cyclohexene-1-carboxylic-acid synthase [Candidatus Omnitrophota bacterium]